MNPVSKGLLGALVAIIAITGLGISPAQAASRHHRKMRRWDSAGGNPTHRRHRRNHHVHQLHRRHH